MKIQTNLPAYNPQSGAATAYIVCGFLWNILVFGTTTYLVFGPGDHSGWWYLLAICLCAGSIRENVSKMMGTWKPEHDPKEDD